MERFGYSSTGLNVNSDVDDRYGFHRDLDTTSGSWSDPKPHFKLTISPTGNVKQDLLPPIPESTIQNRIVVTMKDFERAMTSRWMQKYAMFGRDFLSALRDEMYVEDDSTPSSKYKPTFVGCVGSLDDETNLNAHHLSMLIHITEESRDKKVSTILPFGQTYVKLDYDIVTLTLHDAKEEFIGYAYGQITSYRDLTAIEITRVHDFKDTPMGWDCIPVGTGISLTMNIGSSETDQTKPTKEDMSQS